jgi:hypothetical protein
LQLKLGDARPLAGNTKELDTHTLPNGLMLPHARNMGKRVWLLNRGERNSPPETGGELPRERCIKYIDALSERSGQTNECVRQHRHQSNRSYLDRCGMESFYNAR